MVIESFGNLALKYLKYFLLTVLNWFKPLNILLTLQNILNICNMKERQCLTAFVVCWIANCDCSWSISSSFHLFPVLYSYKQNFIYYPPFMPKSFPLFKSHSSSHLLHEIYCYPSYPWRFLPPMNSYTSCP